MSDDIDHLTIETVEREIASGFKTLLFSPPLEQRFEDSRHDERTRSFIRTGLMATILYDLFLFSDAQMIPDVFGAAVVVRLGIFTPLFLLSAYVVTRCHSRHLREAMATGLAILSVSLVMFVLSTSRSPYTITYQYGSVLIMLFSSLVIRLRLRCTATALVVSIAVQLIAITHLQGTSPKLLQSQIIFFMTAGILMAVSAYVLEHEQRHGYLLGLRSTLLNAQLDKAAKIDPLTGLGNRRYLSAVMDIAFGNADKHPKPVSAILLDIDHFKLFNDACGHQAGDRCLQQIGDCVRVACASFPGATAIRFGGEEFLVFLDGADTSVARLMAQHIQSLIKAEAIAHPRIGQGVDVTASIGIASVLTASATFDDLIAAADKALYIAKDLGRNRISIAPVIEGAAAIGAPDLAMAS